MRTLNEFAYKYIEPIFFAKKMAWVCSPWISKAYAQKLYDLSRKGVEVRIITSDDSYNSDTYNYLSQLLPRNSEVALTNFDFHFVKKGDVHSKIYVVDEKYAVTGAVNFTYTGLTKQTNNFTIAENEEVKSVISDFMKLWIAFKSENVRPTQLTITNILPILPYEQMHPPEIVNRELLKIKSAKIRINPYYVVRYSLLENVRLPWYQQTVVEDKGIVVIDASTPAVLNARLPFDHPVIRDLSNISPLQETVLNTSDKFEIENLEWNSKVDSFKAEQLAVNYIQERNRRNIPYNDRYEGQKYQSYLPSHRAITIISIDFRLLPAWHFGYFFGDKTFERIVLASSGRIIKSDFHLNGAVCEDCGQSIAQHATKQCPACKKWLCPSEMVVCSSCQGVFHKVHLWKTCSICGQMLCNQCLTTCSICKKEYGKNHSVNCHDCGLAICTKCSITSGIVFRKTHCPACEQMKAR